MVKSEGLRVQYLSIMVKDEGCTV